LGVDTFFESVGAAWRVFDQEIVRYSGSDHVVVLGRKETQLERMKVPKNEYRALGETIENYFRRSWPIPFQDVLIRFGDIPGEHPDLFEAIVELPRPDFLLEAALALSAPEA